MGTDESKIPIGISSCQLGERVRYDGGHKGHSYITRTLGEYFDFKPFCSELAIGLGIPRKPIRLSRSDKVLQWRHWQRTTPGPSQGAWGSLRFPTVSCVFFVFSKDFGVRGSLPVVLLTVA